MTFFVSGATTKVQLSGNTTTPVKLTSDQTFVWKFERRDLPGDTDEQFFSSLPSSGKTLFVYQIVITNVSSSQRMAISDGPIASLPAMNTAADGVIWYTENATVDAPIILDFPIPLQITDGIYVRSGSAANTVHMSIVGYEE